MSPESLSLCVPIYLNQKIVFDLLAMIEDGFSEFRDVTSSSSEAEARKHSLEAGVSASNLLQFIGLTLKGGAQRNTERSNATDDLTTEKRIHTPTSLFYKLRARLSDRDDPLINQIEDLGELTELSSGQFVEFRAILRKNPLVELLEMFSTWANIGLQMEALESGQVEQAEAQQLEEQITQALLSGFTGNPLTSANPNPIESSPEKQLAEQNPIYRMIKLFETALVENGSLEIVGELLDVPDATAVLSTKFEGFENGNPSEIIDGEFRVLGKVIRVVSSKDEDPINLLRKTPFGAIKEEQISELADLLSNQEGQEDNPIQLPEIRTTIDGPAILILPIAIFV